MRTLRRDFLKLTSIAGAGIVTGSILPLDFSSDNFENELISDLNFEKTVSKSVKDMTTVYQVTRSEKPILVDAVWGKSQWVNVAAIDITNFMGQKPLFTPVAKAKMMYDDENMYVIFLVEDRFVRCITDQYNGPVWQDSCVEFFFSPDVKLPLRYFNLEVNCGGTPLMRYNIIPRKEFTTIPPEDIRSIEIAHSLPQIVDPEITEPVTWTIEFKMPLALLEKYCSVSYPKPGTIWKANFYKVAEITTNPHYITWAPVDNPVPDFHLPQYFGVLQFI